MLNYSFAGFASLRNGHSFEFWFQMVKDKSAWTYEKDVRNSIKEITRHATVTVVTEN